MLPAATMRTRSVPAAVTAGLFVFIWSTGFLVARLVAPHAEPMAFLAFRIVTVAILLAAIALARGVSWPGSATARRQALVSGLLMQGVYIGGVFWSVSRGLPAGIAALIGSLQPLVTAALAGPLLSETVAPRRWMGIGVGFCGTGLVLTPKLGAVDASGIPPAALGVCLAAMMAMTLGTILQKRMVGGTDLLANAALQFVGAALLIVPLAALIGHWRFDPGWPLALGLVWSVVVNSIVSILLLLALIRRGAVVGVASLLFLVPPVSAVLAFLMFGETLTPVQVAGMAVAAGGVALTNRA